MQHGASFLAVNNAPIQEAIAVGRDRETVKYLKQEVAWYAVYGFQYAETSFAKLGHLLGHDYGFTPFKYKDVKEGATYDTEKHPDAWGRVRGRDNVNSQVSWLCLDIDDSLVTADEMHHILSTINHHIARTSNKDNPYKFRVMVELSQAVLVSEAQWKFFLRSVGDYLGIAELDMLGRSQVFYGYNDREILSVTNREPLDPHRHIEMAKMKVAELEEKNALAYPPGQRAKALQYRYSTFGFAYDATDGTGTTKMMAAVYKAKELGADREYIIDLVHRINNFWDHPMTQARLNATIMVGI